MVFCLTRKERRGFRNPGRNVTSRVYPIRTERGYPGLEELLYLVRSPTTVGDTVVVPVRVLRPSHPRTTRLTLGIDVPTRGTEGTSHVHSGCLCLSLTRPPADGVRVDGPPRYDLKTCDWVKTDVT